MQEKHATFVFHRFKTQGSVDISQITTLCIAFLSGRLGVRDGFLSFDDKQLMHMPRHRKRMQLTTTSTRDTMNNLPGTRKIEEVTRESNKSRENEERFT